jgi:hypothetical protein
MLKPLGIHAASSILTLANSLVHEFQDPRTEINAIEMRGTWDLAQ